MIKVSHRVPWRRVRRHTPTVRSQSARRGQAPGAKYRDLCQLDTSLEYFTDEQNGGVLRLFI